MKRKPAMVEARAVVVKSFVLRQVASALSSAANVAAESLLVGDSKERDRARAIVDECTAGLFALVVALIPEIEA